MRYGNAAVYNKLFTKILDSSIWLEPAPTRLVWLTFLAAMDQDGFCRFAAPANVAHRARVSLEEAETAIKTLESPDPNSSNPANEGRRIERVPGGWIILNAEDHQQMVTRAVQREQTKERVRRYRERKGNASVTHRHDLVTPSDTHTDTDPKTETEAKRQNPARSRALTVGYSSDFSAFWEAYPKKTGKGEAWKTWQRSKPLLSVVLEALAWQTASDQWNRDGGRYRPNPATYLNQRRWEDEPSSPATEIHERVLGKGGRAAQVFDEVGAMMEARSEARTGRSDQAETGAEMAGHRQTGDRGSRDRGRLLDRPR